MISNSKTVGKLTYVSLTEIGTNHKKLKIPNQDAVLIEVVQEDFVMAVSDGVGSCKKAKAGAQMVVSICRNLFFEVRKGDIPFDGGSIVEKIIDTWKESIEGDLSDYCATVKVVMKVGKKAVIISLGDGFAAIASEGIKAVSPNEDSTFANQTKCLDETICMGDFGLKILTLILILRLQC